MGEEDEEEEVVNPESAAKPRRDPRLNVTDQSKFFATKDAVAEMLHSELNGSHSLLSKDTGLGSGHGLASGSALKSDRPDPLKEAVAKAHSADHGIKKRVSKYTEHADKLSEVYGQYLMVDTMAKPKKKR